MTILTLTLEPDYQTGNPVQTVLNLLAEKCLDTNDATRPSGPLDAYLIVIADRSLAGLSQAVKTINQQAKLPGLLDIGTRLKLAINQDDYKRFIKVAPMPLFYQHGGLIEAVERFNFAKHETEAPTRAARSQSLADKLASLGTKKADHESNLKAVSVPTGLPLEVVDFSSVTLEALASQLQQTSLSDKPHALGLLFISEPGGLEPLKEVIA